VKEELRLRVLANPMIAGRLCLFPNSFESHPYKRPTIGIIEELNSASWRTCGLPRRLLPARQRHPGGGRQLRSAQLNAGWTSTSDPSRRPTADPAVPGAGDAAHRRARRGGVRRQRSLPAFRASIRRRGRAHPTRPRSRCSTPCWRGDGPRACTARWSTTSSSRRRLLQHGDLREAGFLRPWCVMARQADRDAKPRWTWSSRACATRW
jgi:hypothetical protein